MLKYQLVSNTVGVLTINNADPIDINSTTKTVKRSAQYEGAIYEVIQEVRFIKAAREYLIDCFENDGGVDAVVFVNLYEYKPNIRRWRIYSTSQVDWNRKEIDEESFTTNLKQFGIENSILNLMEQDVNLETPVSENGSELPDQFAINVELHSKTLLEDFISKPSHDLEVQQLDVATFNIPAFIIPPTFDIGFVAYAQLDTDEIVDSDLEEHFDTPAGFEAFENPGADDQLGGVGTDIAYTDFLALPENISLRNPKVIPNAAGTMDIKAKVKIKAKFHATNIGGDIDLKSPSDSGVLGHCEVYLWCEHRADDDTIYFIEKVGQLDIPGYGGNDRDSDWQTFDYSKLAVVHDRSDKFYVYATYRVWGHYQAPNAPGPDGSVTHDLSIELDPAETLITFETKTVDEASQGTGVLLFEAVQRCLQYYSNQVVILKSDLLGRTDLGYDVDGEASLILWTNGHRIRQRTQKQLFASLKQILDFINSKFCIGYGFKTIEGITYFIVEKRSYFYDKNTKVLSLGKVYNIKKVFDNKRVFNRIEDGYSTKIDIKQVNAIDEFNTFRTTGLPIVNTKNKLQVATDVIAGGYPIEKERRLRTSKEDGKYDDSNFVIVVIRDGDNFKSKKDEGYEYILNVFSPETGYNYDLSPGRTRINWYKVIGSAMLKSLRTSLKFLSGEVNYEMITKKISEGFEVKENGNVDLVGVEPDYEPENFKAEKVRFSSDQMQAICENPFGYIELQDKNDVTLEGFVSVEGITHEHEDGTADIELLKVNRKLL